MLELQPTKEPTDIMLELPRSTVTNKKNLPAPTSLGFHKTSMGDMQVQGLPNSYIYP